MSIILAIFILVILQLHGEFLTPDQVSDFKEQIVRLISVVRDSPNAAYALESMVNGSSTSPDSGSLVDVDFKSCCDGNVPGPSAAMARPMSVKEFLQIQLQANGVEHGPKVGLCGSPPTGADLCSDAEYFTPLSSPDDSRRSSIDVLSEEVKLLQW